MDGRWWQDDSGLRRENLRIKFRENKCEWVQEYALTLVVISGPFMKNFPCNHSVNINIIIFFFRRSKRQRNFSLFYFAS
jgi:hypothetical protein